MTPDLTPSRLAYRGTTDPLVIREILENNVLCTVSFVEDGQARALPTGYVLYEDHLIIHGSVKSAFLEKLVSGQVCITVFTMNALVLAASALHHSMNYDSVVVYSSATEITDPARKESCLRAFTEQVIPGRWEKLRPITQGELIATRVLAFPITTASAKRRVGGPSDEKEDENYPVWTGILPVSRQFGTPEPVSGKKDMELPEHILSLLPD